MFIFTFETVVGAILVLILVGLKVYWFCSDWFKQSKCEHNDCHKDPSFNVICLDCKKNLGSIWAVKEARKG